MDKNHLADTGLLMARMFCEKNNIAVPAFHIYREADHPEAKKIKAVGTCGYYRQNNIHVSIPACAFGNPNYSWPGFISDRTPYGVIQHELGHHVDEVRSGLNVYRNKSGDFFSDRIRKISGEKPITSYAPNTMEWFAEIFRLFVTNPDLLSIIRPKAYNALILEGGLQPVIDLNSEDVLLKWNCPPRIFERAHDWIAKKK